MTNYREILRLKSLGLNNTEIGEAVGTTRQTVGSALEDAEKHGLKWPLPDTMTNQEIFKIFHPYQIPEVVYEMPDVEWVYKELQKPDVNLNLLWNEYQEKCIAAKKVPYKITQFKKYCHDYAVKQQLTMHLDHKPGDIMQVDWAGDTLHMVDTTTGELLDVYLFVSTLPCSGYSYCEPFLTMGQESWITAHVNAFNYFGGVPHIIQCDNLKTGVITHTKSDVVLNKTYQDMAEHYNVAILPARVRKPKDKAHVEGTVGIVSTWIIAALRNRQFLTEWEVKDAVAGKLEEFNNKPFQKKDGSRKKAFEEERLFLSALPKQPFEIATWKKATPGLNYHISVDRQNYSVPYEYVKQPVDVRLTKSTVEVFYNGNRICSHQRLTGHPGQYSTNTEHMPKKHQEYLQWNGDRFRSWANKIGPNTAQVVEYLLTKGTAEQQGYKACMSLLKLADKYTADRLEITCSKVLRFTTKPSYKSVQEILKAGLDKDIPTPTAMPSDSTQYGFVRGADYFGKEGV